MSSSRNKRKRPENDSAAMAPSSRRRSRDQRAAPEVSAPDAKNEGTSKIDIGEPATKASPASSQIPKPDAKSRIEPLEENPKTSKSLSSANIKRSSHNTKPVGQGADTSIAPPSASDKESSSSQNEPATTIQALHLSEGNGDATASSNPDKNTPPNDRESRIRALISHRSLLLERMSLCRSSAEERLRDYRSIARTPGEKTPQSDGTAISEMTDDEEITAFREMTKQATQAAKKSRSDGDSAAEKRTSLSLRRGSSVGKRMNAALSSLAPGSSAGANVDGALTQATPVLSLPQAKVSSKPPQGVAVIPKSSQQQVLSTTSIGALPPPAKIPPPTKFVKTSSNQIQQSSKEAAHSSREVGQKSRAPNSKSLKALGTANTRPSSVSRTDPVTLPLHVGAGTSALPPNRLTQPQVNFPEANALREKRETIQSRLKFLLEVQQRNTKISDSPQGLQRVTIPGSKSKKQSYRGLFELDSNPSLQLPMRRKTHWDSLLKEMSWLATDFIEERKWKMSSARTISSLITTPGLSISAKKDSAAKRKPGSIPSSHSDQQSMGMNPKVAGDKADIPKAKKKALVKTKQVDERKYANPSHEDFKFSRKVGRLLCSMISELGSATREAGSMGRTDQSHVEALERYRQSRLQLTGKKSSDPSSTGKEDESNGESTQFYGAPQGDTDGVSRMDVDAPTDKMDEKIDEKSFEEITEFVESLQRMKGKSRNRSSKEMANALVSEKLNLTAVQRDVVDFADKLWDGNSSLGMVLVGPSASGLTITTCSIMWKEKSFGPQLLVCAPTSVFRWKYEISRFSNMRPFTLGITGGISSPDSSEGKMFGLEAGDIIVCEHASLHRALNLATKQNFKFHAVIIDSRQRAASIGFRGAIGSNNVPSTDSSLWQGATELISTSWWAQVLKLIKSGARRLILEYPNSDILSLSTSGLGAKQQLEILALRTACIIGPDVFFSPNFALHRRIIAWARKRGKKSVPDKVARVRQVLFESVEPMCIQISETLASSSKFEWDLRRCSMSLEQREKYDKCCSEVRGALSSTLDDTKKSEKSRFHSFHAVSKALLRLRRQCFHAQPHEIITNVGVRSRLGTLRGSLSVPTSESVASSLFWRKTADSPAQPNSDISFHLLNGSAKLRELSLILKFECGYKLHGEDFLQPLLDSNRKEKPKAGSKQNQTFPKKVAILAVLPEVQLLVSVLLNSLGIQHDCLLRESCISAASSNGPQQKSTAQSIGPNHYSAMALAWAECQSTLARFSAGGTLRERLGLASPTSIVIACPSSLATWNNGLGLDSADLIISLDEDWTGRGELILNSLLARWHARSSLSGISCHPIRLLCSDTFEEKLFESFESGSSDIAEWPEDALGYLTLSEANHAALSRFKTASNCHIFPALSMLRLRGKLLSDILLPSNALPPLFESGAPVRFLPYGRKGDGEAQGEEAGAETNAEISFLSEYLRHEHLASANRQFLTEAPFENQYSRIQEKEVGLTKLCLAPPRAAFFPKEVMTRKDLPILVTRYYLDQQCQSAIWNPAIGTVIQAAQLPDPPLKGVPTSDSIVNPTSDLADAWHKSGLSCKPDDVAASLLIYRTGIKDDHRAGLRVSKSIGTTGGVQPSEQNLGVSVDLARSNRRFNAYAKLYSYCWNGNLMRDGNQGCEPLVFFPPLLPRIYECTMRAKIEWDTQFPKKQVPTPPNSKSPSESASTGGPALTKRQDREAPELGAVPNSKRMRITATEMPAPMEQASTSSMPSSLLPLGSTILNPKMEASAHCSDGHGGLGDSGDSRVITEDEASIRGSTAAPLEIYEDYGLLGAGVIPSATGAASFVAHDAILNGGITGLFSENRHEFLSYPIPCDREESELMMSQARASRLNLVILFTKKKPRVFSAFSDGQAHIYRPHRPVDHAWAGSNPTPIPASIPGVGSSFRETNGDEAAKKTKKKVPIQNSLDVPLTAFARLAAPDLPQGRPVPPPNVMHYATGKDGHRHRLLASFVSRQFGTGLSMFESTSYRVAAIHVTNRVTQRVERLLWKTSLSYETGPGLPLLPAQESHLLGVRSSKPSSGLRRSWKMVVEPLKKNAATGDTAKFLSAAQRSALRRSLVSPCRVDFGPFDGGYLAVPSGMTGISPPRSRLGVSLPMGVKVPQALLEQPQPSWTADDDKLLQNCAVRFGMNWMLVARALSGFEDVVVSEKIRNDVGRKMRSLSRSARQCRDRWQTLARSQPSLANEVRKSERVLRESALMRLERIPGSDSSVITVAASGRLVGNFQRVSLLSRPVLFDKLAQAKQNESSLMPPNKSDIGQEDGEKISSAETAAVVSNAEGEKSYLKAPTVQPTQQRRSFSVLSAAKTKRQFIPLTIPGLVSGNPPTQPVPSHPSHMQSVQASVAAQWSNGRTEMWPLQILDCADKHRAAARPSSSGPRTSDATATSGSVSSGRRQPHSGDSSGQARRSPSSRDRPASFPPVPGSSIRSSSNRAPTHTGSPQRSQPSSSTKQAYAPPKSAASTKNEVKSKPGQKKPSS